MSKILFEKEFKALGTEINLWLVISEKENVSKLIEELENFYRQKEKIFNRFDPESELSIRNSNLGKFQKVSADILNVSKKCLDYAKFSQDFFDPRILGILEKIGYAEDFRATDFKAKEIENDFPEKFENLEEDLKINQDEVFFNKRMDFSGVAKGYITDEATRFLKSQGYENFLIDSGGDIFAAGKNEKNLDWEVILEGFQEDKFSLEIFEKGIATSGITRRKWENKGKKYHHLVNPKDPDNFSFDLKSVTVIEETTEKADVYAKILFLMGKEAGLQFSKINNLASIFLDYKGNIFVSAEAKKYINKKYA